MANQPKTKFKRSATAFAHIRFAGVEAKGRRLTSTMMRDLIAYTEVVKAVARDMWREERSEKLPKNFDNNFQVSVGNLQSGSTVCDVRRESTIRGRRGGDLLGEDDVFARAQVRVLAALKLGDSGGEYDGIVERHIARLVATSSEWDAKSVMEIFARGDVEPARITQGVRKRIQNLRPREIATEVKLVGVVFGVITDKNKDTFVMRTMLDRRVDGSFPPALRAEFMSAHLESYVICASGILRMVNEHTTFFVRRIEPVAVPRGMDVAYVKRRIAELRELEDGWLDGKGKSIDRGIVESVLSLLRVVVEEIGLPPPLIFPREDGGLSLEWKFAQSSCIVAYDAEDGQAYADAFHNETGRGPHFYGPHASATEVSKVVRAASRGEQE